MRHNRSLYSRAMTFFGYGRGASRARKNLVSLYWHLGWGFIQIVVIIVMLILSATRFESPTSPGISEWAACDRPLGAWAALWAARVVFASTITYWGFVRDKKMYRWLTSYGRYEHVDLESGTPLPRRGGASTPNLPRLPDMASTSTPNARPPAPPLPHTQLYSRLALMSSLLTLGWFMTAHVLQYPSINTCRHSSPHIWWLTFSILCIMYLMVLEVLLLGFVVLIIAPILFLFWNIFLICIGRHPVQRPPAIKPEIEKLPKSIVDTIPLVLYIPPPPDVSDAQETTFVAPHVYPPQEFAAPTPTPTKRRFRFIRSIPSLKKSKSVVQSPTPLNGPAERLTEKPLTWEQHWEPGEYPFVVLEGNRAACAICLMDFEEPPKITRLDPATELSHDIVRPEASTSSQPSEASAHHIVETAREQLRLEDAGEGAQPLRLLSCGHVFHQSCLDPWLTDVSGRCPICQRAAITPGPPKRGRDRPAS
ncbi:hypothetical protein BD779DRAFT_1758941 [Infundibulicybe gibba]|nr:hypothetical protein BD779DRAFT_1758941 [Infundibulicybe gibba]